MNQAKALQVQQEVQLRFLCPADVGEVKKLCTEWFPIEYPDSWYDDITSSSRFYSLAATHQSRIVGLIVAELKAKSKLNKEDGDILASYYPSSMQVAYILSLGVVDDFRRNGIDYIAHCGSLISKLQPCGLPRQLYRAVRNMVQRFLSRPPVEVSHSS
ncbi:hypothetical protein C0Q70_00867 [Pomacea canaliculata]|uniref:histone acetyltransferase n=1 Tax=Pomacea canaliculata TaxID=400727 RepID=A0A2T7PXV3_POMCA|nr:hypothetical protein C0Q70_00867 [Pomacea canaliculata]